MKLGIPTVVAVLAALILAPASKADPATPLPGPGYERFSRTDIGYLQELNMFGMNPVALHAPSLSAEVALGQRICLDLGPGSGGSSPNDLVTNMQRSLPNLTQQQIQMLVTAAVTNYCP
jgi:hypothetical protein